MREKTTTEIICKQCGIKFYHPYWRAKDTKFCSHKCRGLSNVGINHPRFNGGHPKCIDCGKQLRTYCAKRCKSCAGKLRIWPDAVRLKISISNKGRRNSPESIEKARQKLIGRKVWNKGLSRYKTKEEHKKEINKRRRFKFAQLSKKERLGDLIRTRIRNAYKVGCKNSSTVELLGCSIEFFRKYIELKFQEGMNWNNYGNGEKQWNIDHIKPISSFDLTKEEEQMKAFHFTNCQPMWALENFKKSNKQ